MMSKAYLVIAKPDYKFGDTYAIGYAKAKSPYQAKKLSFAHEITGNCGIHELSPRRCKALDNEEFEFMEVAEITAGSPEYSLLLKHGLCDESLDYFRAKGQD